MQLLTVKEAAARLRVGRTLLYDLMNSGQLAFVQLRPRVRRIEMNALDTYVANQIKASRGLLRHV